MNHEEYTRAVDLGAWPTACEVPMPQEFIDHRGIITNVLYAPTTSVAEIRSKRGSVRANHWHRTDWHYTYVVSGEVAYFHRDIGDTNIPEPQKFGPGEMFFTPPNREHAMLFTKDSVVFTFARNVRTHDNHEADLVRVEFVTPEIASKYL